jgi:tetratricopeptide (TPR) repeat protein
MNTATPQRDAPRPIKGSWEDLHAQAQQLARNYNDNAIPIYQRVFNGLTVLPPAARAAGNNRLYNLMMTTGVELQGYLNLRDRYDESLGVIDKMLSVVAEADKPQIIELKSDVLLQAERGEEAIALLRELSTSADADAGDWGHMVAGYIRMKQPERALALVDEMDKWIESQIASSELQGQEITEARYYQERLRAAALLDLGRIDDAVELFNGLYDADGADAISPHLIYTRLLQEGMHDQALRYINRDQKRPVRAAFWRGLAYHYMGEEARAKRVWTDAIAEEFTRSDVESIVEHILTRYYLGDENGAGLEIMLRAQREQTRLSWMIFFLTGLGWILRGDDKAAHSNLRLAVSQIKSMGEGKTLAHQYWRFVKDLAPADRAARYAQYFDTRSAAAAPSSAPATESIEETSAASEE